MQRMTEFGVPRRIVAFVMPTGYSFNLDGSTLYLGVASIFVAQAAGVHLSIGQQLVMMLTLLITSKGVAAVPRASLVMLSGTLTAFGLPLEGVAVILGVDELMDMARTMVNLVGQLPGHGRDGAVGRGARPGGVRGGSPADPRRGRARAVRCLSLSRLLSRPGIE